MNRTQKYLACTAIALSSIFSASAAADTPRDKLKVSSAQLHFHVLQLNINSQAILNGYKGLQKLQKYATSQKNQELLSLTNMAIKESTDRILKICTPLYSKVEEATLKEDQALEAKTQNRISNSYKKLHKQFMHECSPNVFPSIMLPQTGRQAGKILSDVTLDRSALLRWNVHYLSLAITQLEESYAHLQKHKNTSGTAYIDRMLRHLETSEKVTTSCRKYARDYKDLVFSSKDLLEIRRKRAELAYVCSQKVKF